MQKNNENLCKVRTITAFLSLTRDKDTWASSLYKASTLFIKLSESLISDDYEVQSIRIVTNPFGEYLDTNSIDSAKKDLLYLSGLLDVFNKLGLRIRFAIGEAKNEHEIGLVPELIRSFGDLSNVCVNIDCDDGVLNNDLIRSSAEAVLNISKLVPRGEGNFNFTVNFNCEPHIPYFPASYHEKSMPDCFVIGLETPDLLVDVVKNTREKNADRSHKVFFTTCYSAMSKALQENVDNINHIVESIKGQHDFFFAGIDSSAAPSKNCASLVELYELMGVEYFGAAGTIEVSSLLTKVFKSISNVKLKGFSGLMLAPTEDTGLAAGTIRGDFDIRALLTYSAVCGIGLDTVPIPGDTSMEKISALMRDTGTMAYRLNKPLTVRLFPIPGSPVGEQTQFESVDLCNCAIMAVP